MKSVIALSLVGAAAAFAPASTGKVSTAVQASLDGMPGSTKPLEKFDPLALAMLGNDQTLAWFRAAELKHSRAAMLASAGFIVQAAGFHFPGMLSKDISFESLSGLNPIDQWAQVPDAGKAQIIALIGAAELFSETKKPHYMMGGELPTMIFPPIDFSGVDAKTLKVKQDRELNNGRLAMIAIMSFISEYNIPGSVPVLSGIDAF